MKNMILVLRVMLPISIAAVLSSGCSSPSESTSAPATTETPTAAATPTPTPASTAPTSLEGSWKGRDVTPGQEGPATLVFKGRTVDFHGATDQDWLKGTFIVREDTNPKQWVGTVTDCSSSDEIGKKAYAIYKLEDGTLTIAGSQLGDPEFPTSFDAAGARQFVFKHE